MIKLKLENPTVMYEDAFGRKWEYYHVNFGDVMKTFYDRYSNISESNYSRLVTHINNGCFMISACRGDKSEKVNKVNTESLAGDIRAEGLGYIRVLGGFIENKGTDNETTVTEESFFVPQPKNVSDDDFFDIAIKLCKKYEQDDVLISMPGYIDFGYYDKNGNFDGSPGDKLIFTDDSVKEYFTALIKGSKRNKKWAFSTEWLAVRHPISVPQAALMSKNKENLHII